MERKIFHDLHIGIFVRDLPVFIPASFFVLIGIIGNILTINFFSKAKKPSVPWILIKYMAVSDLVVCLVAVPVCLEMVFNIQYDQSILCKITHFLGNWGISCSTFILLTTAADRYRKICHPLQRQMQVLTLRYMIFAGIFGGLLLSVRQLITFGSIEVTIAIDSDNSTLKENHCAAKCDGRYKNICLVFYVIEFVIITTGISVVIVLYSKTIYTLFRRKSDICRSMMSSQNAFKNRKGIKRGSISSASDNKDCIIEAEQKPQTNAKITISQSENSFTNIAFSADKNFYKNSVHEKSNVSVIVEHKLKRKCNPKPPKGNFEMRSFKSSFEWYVTIMMFTTTMVFIMCFIPYFAVRVLIRLVLKTGSEYNFNPWIQFALKLPYLNSAFNPIVYSIFNVKFRRFITNCFKKKKSVNHSIGDNTCSTSTN